MDHSHIKKIYEEIRNEPFMPSTKPGVEASNCYFKGLSLIKNLTECGYNCRGRVAEMDWQDTPVPDEIVSKIPKGEVDRHFFVEAWIDNELRVLDPSIDPITEKLGFQMVGFEGNSDTCFNLKKIYSHEEQVQFLAEFSQPHCEELYFKKMNPFLVALNNWLTEERANV